MVTACPSEACGRCDCVDLTERESMVCHFIRDSAEPVTFSELKRESSLHQELVSRIVHRLVKYGLAEKVEGGYRSLCTC